MIQPPLETIAEAFSRTAARYDSFGENHPHLMRMRRKVYAHLTSRLPTGARILELNAGTGTDAIELAKRGYFVHATDISTGMLERLSNKLERLDLSGKITIQQCSFTALQSTQGAPYDAVFSNLGGLNCCPDLSPVIASLKNLLRPGGTVIWVLMPPVCLWELAMILTGQVRFGLRRLSRRAHAHLEGLYFDVYYFTPQQVIGWFGADFELVGLEGLSVITPTAESKNLARRIPRLYRFLCWLDDRLSIRPPWWGWGDFFILSLKYRVKN